METKMRVFGLGLCALLLLGTCNLFLRPQAPGDMRIDFDLGQPRQLGYEVDRVHCTLSHQSSGKVVERDLGIEGDTASGAMRGLRVGKWDLLVELYEDGVVIGEANREIEIRSGEMTEVTLQIQLASGDLQIIVSWEVGTVILELDLGQFAVAEYDVAKVHYILTHYASGDTKEGDAVPVEGIAYVEIPELWVGTWDVELQFIQTGALEPLVTTTYDLDVDPGSTLQLELEYPTTNPLELTIFRPVGPIQLYGWPDLKPSGFVAPPIAAPGEVIGPDIYLDVLNDGIGVAPAKSSDGTITVAFYRSETSYLGATSVLIGSVDVSTPIAAETSVEVAVPVDIAIPEDTPDGKYYVLAQVDADLEATELSELNNLASSAVTVAGGEDGASLWPDSSPILGSTFGAFDIAGDGDGGMYIARQLVAEVELWLARVDHTGYSPHGYPSPLPGPLWDEVIAPLDIDVVAPTVVHAPTGGAIVAWEEKSGSTSTFKARRVDPGWLPWPSAVALSTTQSANDYTVLSAGDGGSGAFVAYGTVDGGLYRTSNLVHVSALTVSPALDGVVVPFGLEALVEGVDNTAIVIGQDGASEIRANSYTLSAGDLVPNWGSSGVLVGQTVDTSTTVKAVTDGDGGAFIVWNTTGDYGAVVRAQHVNGSGTPLWGGSDGVLIADLAGPNYGMMTSDIGADDTGGAIVVWSDWRNVGDGYNSDIYAQRVDFSGTAVWATGGVMICRDYLLGETLTPGAAGQQIRPAICRDAAGGAVVVWEDFWGISRNIRACRLDPNGALLWSRWIIDDDEYGPNVAGNEQKNPKIALSEDGPGSPAALIAWEEETSGGGDYNGYQKVAIRSAP